MRHRKSIALILPILLFVSMSFKCDGDSVSDIKRKYAKALDEIVESLDAMTNLKQSLAQQRQITPEEDNRLARVLGNASDFVAAARTKVNSITAFEATPDKVEIALLRQGLSFSFAKLDNEILSIDEATSKIKLQGLLKNAKASLKMISKLTSNITKGCEDLDGEKCFRCPPDPCIYCKDVPPSCPQ